MFVFIALPNALHIPVVTIYFVTWMQPMLRFSIYQIEKVILHWMQNHRKSIFVGSAHVSQNAK